MKTLLYNNEDHQAALLRSVLLFNSKKVDNSKDNILRMSILSLALNVTAYKECTVEYIIQCFKHEFGYELDRVAVDGHIKKLADMNLIQISENSVITVKDCTGRSFFCDLEVSTNNLINNIYVRLTQAVQVPNKFESQIRTNIKNALIAYYNLFGHEFLGTQKVTSKAKLPDVLSFVRENLSEQIGETLILTIADVLAYPNDEDKATLETWAKAYAITQIINLDPKLREYKRTMFKDKEFIVDTDVLLNCLTTNARYSDVYKSMISILRGCNCKFYIPQQVFHEVCDHADAAIKRRGFYGEASLREFTDLMLEGEDGNVFIEDYVKQVRHIPENSDMRFKDYISNIYSNEYPELLKENIKNIFGERVFDNRIDESDVDAALLDDLTSKLYNMIVYTHKGSFRADDDNMRICRADALYYLYISKYNKSSGSDMLSGARKIYLLTRSTRTVRCALDMKIYENNIICNPIELIPILDEIGLWQGDSIDYINLFENPFLVYAAQKVWKDVEPIIKDGGLRLKFADLNKLRLDANVNLHKMLTADTIEEQERYADEYADKDYEVAKVFRDLLKENKALKEEKDKQIEVIKNLVDDNRSKDTRIKALEKVAPKVRTAKNISDKGKKKKK